MKIYFLLLKIASLNNPKAKKFIAGRKDLLKKISSEVDPNIKSAWFHFASLGEFEQGRPVIEKFKNLRPGLSIVITFFSPSGYEIRKNYSLADHVFYLPLDTAKNATDFIRLINPQLAIFTKYEYWYHYYKSLNKNGIPLFVISAIFKKNTIFFKWHGGFNRKILHFVTHFFVQNKESADLLKSIGILNTTISGDTRFDRVVELALNPLKIDLITDFVKDKSVFIGGSTWPEDEQLISRLTQLNPTWKFIIAPHEIEKDRIKEIEKIFPNSVKLSEIKNPEILKESLSNPSKNLNLQFQTLIIDEIGLLSSLYQYGKIAYIGGGFGNGIHNTLEAVAFGVPVIFGPNYTKFQEAKDLINLGIGKSISSETDLVCAFEYFKETENSLAIAKKYVNDKKGATHLILEKITA